MKICGMKRAVKTDRYHLFIFMVTVVKIVCMGLFTSDYQEQLFIPFAEYYVANGGNPWDAYYEYGITNAFPYPIGMLFIQSLGVFLRDAWGMQDRIWINFTSKIPSLVFDFIGLYVLVRMFPAKRKYAAVFYFASPIILYAVYMHGQLDLIPTVLLFAAVYVLTSGKNGWGGAAGSCLLIAALLTKLHILAAVPVIILYLYKRDGLKKTAVFTACTAAGTMAGLLPFATDAFRVMVLFNAEQDVITQVSLTFAHVKMYIPIVSVLLVYLAAFQVDRMNRDLLISLCGVVFAVFLAFCPPMPGWYVWIVPYVTIFFVNVDLEKNKNIVIYMLLNILYVVYFVFLHNRGMTDLYLIEQDLSFIKMRNPIIGNVFFTLLSGTLLYITASIYQLGVASNSLYKRRGLPFTIGIAGDSGAGKSTFIHILEKGLGKDSLIYIEGDGDHKWERGEKHWEEFTHLNPKANYLYRQAADLKCLRDGNAVQRVNYDHQTGKFTKAERVKPGRYVVLCGLHSLYLPQARKYLDLKIYMDIDETLRRYWKIQRDTASRGYTKTAIIRQIEDRMPDAEKYIYPQKDYADMVVQYYDKTLMQCMAENHQEKISIRITISAAVNAEPLIAEFVQRGICVEYDYSNDLKTQTIDLDAEGFTSVHMPIQNIAERIIPQLEEITREKLDADSGKDGVVLLFLLLLISCKMRGEC